MHNYVRIYYRFQITYRLLVMKMFETLGVGTITELSLKFENRDFRLFWKRRA